MFLCLTGKRIFAHAKSRIYLDALQRKTYTEVFVYPIVLKAVIDSLLLCKDKETRCAQDCKENMSKKYNHRLLFYAYKSKINQFNSWLKKKEVLY